MPASPHTCTLPAPPDVDPQLTHLCTGCGQRYRLNPTVLRWFRVPTPGDLATAVVLNAAAGDAQ